MGTHHTSDVFSGSTPAAGSFPLRDCDLLGGKPSVVSVTRNLSSKMANMAFCCAVLVVFIHVGTPTPVGTIPWFFTEPFHAILGDVAVPYFFLASGFFLAGHMGETGWYSREMKKRVWTLLVPYFLWAVLYAVYLVPLAILANLHAHRSWCQNLGFPGWMWTFGVDFFHSPFLFPLWFLRWLMCLCLASPLLCGFVRKTGGWGLMAVYGCIALENIRIVWIGSSWFWSWKWLDHIFGLFFFLFGISWRMGVFEALPNWVKRLPCWLGVAILAIRLASFVSVGFGVATQNGCIGMIYSRYVHFITPFLLAVVWKCMPSKTWPAWLTGASFGLYVMHMFFINVLNSVLWFGRLGLGAGGMCVLRWVVGAGGGLVGVVALKRWCPGLAKLVLGGR